MIIHLRRIYHQYQLFRNYFNNLRQHNSFTHKADRASAINKKTVAFDVEDNRFTRHLYNFIIFFIQSGYKVYVKKRVSFIGNLQDYSKNLLETRNLFFVDQLPSNIPLKFTSVEKKGFVNLRDDYLSIKKTENESLTYPFSMHPMIYKDHLDDEIEELRKSTKKIRVFFAGAIEPEYEHGNFKELFKIIDRYTLFRAIVQHYSPEYVIIIKTEEGLKIFEKSDYLNKIIMMKSPGAVHWVYWDKWYRLLAKADFFLALPGIKIPLCHNLIEAMSLGVIPILQYYDFLAHPLENNVNCIMFKTKDELYEKIDEIKTLGNSEIKKLREGVINYYETYLKPEKFINQIEKKVRDKSLKNIYLYSELNTIDKLKLEFKNDGK